MVHAVMQEALIEIVPAAAAETLGSSHGGVFIGKLLSDLLLLWSMFSLDSPLHFLLCK